MQFPLDVHAAGARELAAVSSFGGEERLRLPFDLQRRHWFLAAFAAVATTLVATAVGLASVIAAGLVVAIAVACAVALSERFGLVLLAVLVPATSGLARGVPVPGVRISQALIAGVGIVALLAARRFVHWTALDWLALLYGVVSLGLGSWDVLQQHGRFGLTEVELLLGPFQFLLLYRATAVTARTPERRRLALRLILWASVPVALLAIGQQLNFPGVRSLIVSLTHNDVYAPGQTARVTGPFPLWHNLAAYLFIILLTIAALLLRRVTGVLSRRVLVAIALVDIAALVETLSIAPIVGVIAGAAILGVWLHGFTRVLIGLALVLMLGALVFGSRIDARYSQQFSRAPGTQRSSIVPQTIQYRYNLWTSELLPLLKGHAITGLGPDLPPQIQNFPYTESLYLNLLFRGGVVLLLVVLGLFASMIRAGIKSTRDRDSLQLALGATVVAALVCLLFMQAIESYFTDDGMPQVLWMLVGLLAFHDVTPLPVALRRRRPTVDDAIRRRAWAGSVATALEKLDPGSREVVKLSYDHQLNDDEVVSVIGLSPEAIQRWRESAVSRIGAHMGMSSGEVEEVLRSSGNGS